MKASAGGPDLTPLFRARSIAVVGVSERSGWCQSFVTTAERLGNQARTFLVRSRGGLAFGRATYPSCAAIGEPIDLAFLFTEAASALDALKDAAAAGARAAVVLAGGFGEAGEEGAAREAELVAYARSRSIALLGPNSLGFMNAVDCVSAGALGPAAPVVPGSLAVVSQSGGMTAVLADAAQRRGVGVSFAISTGNEAALDLAAVLDFLVQDERTRSIVVFAEAIRDPRAFAAAADRALRAEKPIVVLKVGKTKLASAAARAHSGAVCGDERVYEAACRGHGVIRVESVEEAVVTAALVAHTGPLRAPGVALVSYSGGGCELVCDRAEGAGVSLPALSSDTVAALRRALPRVPRPQNPLDLAGSFVHRPAQFEKALAIAAADPSVGITAAIMEASPGCETLFGFVARGLRATDRPGIMVTSSSDPAPPEIREQLAAVGIPFVAYGIDHAVKALGHAAWWSGRVRCAVAGAAPLETCEAAQPASDREVMGHLSAHGVPVAPALLCRTPAEALRAAMAFGRGPLALKVSSPDITHKTDAGGVRLDLQGDAVASAFDDLVATVRRARPDARIEGVLAYPMRPRGVELFVGTRCDPQWGCTIAVGLGGIWVEALADTAVELLPVSVAQVVEMLRSLRGAALLDGYRGAPAVDLEAVAQVVVKIGEAARALGPGLAALEVNPLWARGAKVEALDARILWVDEAAAAAARAKMWLPPPLSDPRAGDQSG